MRKSIVLLLSMIGLAQAQNYQPNSLTFSCPDGDQLDLSKPVSIGIGQRPNGVGECFWRDPKTSFSINNDLTTITGVTTWNLDGGWLADGCSDVKGEKISSTGIITQVSCKTQQQ